MNGGGENEYVRYTYKRKNLKLNLKFFQKGEIARFFHTLNRIIFIVYKKYCLMIFAARWDTTVPPLYIIILILRLLRLQLP